MPSSSRWPNRGSGEDMTIRSKLIGLGVVCLLVVAAIVLDGHAVRATVALACCLVLPGLGWARRLKLRDPGDTMAMTLMISLCSTTVVATGMVLTAHWSTFGGLAVLALVSVLGFLPLGELAARASSAITHRPRPRHRLVPPEPDQEWPDWYADAPRRVEDERSVPVAAEQTVEDQRRSWHAKHRQSQAESAILNRRPGLSRLILGRLSRPGRALRSTRR